MSIAVMTQVWEKSTQKGAALLLLLALADFANAEGIAWPSIETLAQRTRVSERQVQRAAYALEAKGELYIMQGVGRTHPNHYFIPVGKTREEIEATIKGDIFTPFKLSPEDRKRLEKVTFLDVKGDIFNEKGDIAMSPDPIDPSLDPSNIIHSSSSASHMKSDSLAEELDAPITDNKHLNAFKANQASKVLAVEEKETRTHPPVPRDPLLIERLALNEDESVPPEPVGRTFIDGAGIRAMVAHYAPLKDSEIKTPESQFTKESRKNDPPAETFIPNGYKLLTSTDLTEPLHLIPADKGRAAKALCKKPFPFRLFPTPGMSQVKKPCEECWRIATTPKPTKAPPAPRKPQPWDVFADAIAKAGFQGVNDKFVGFVLHGVKKQDCRGIIAVECDLQGKERSDLDYQALADLVPRFWKDYQMECPGKPLRDCSKWTSRWEGWRRTQMTKAQARPKPVAHIRYTKDPVTGKDVGNYCICEIGHNHD